MKFWKNRTLGKVFVFTIVLALFIPVFFPYPLLLVDATKQKVEFTEDAHYGISTEFGDFPPSSGNWIIRNKTRVENRIITLDGNVSVYNSLELINVTIRNIQFFEIALNGSLNAIECSFVGRNGTNNQIKVMGNSTFVNCTIENFGYVDSGSNWPIPAVRVSNSSNTKFISTIFLKNVVPLSFLNCQNVLINGSIFYQPFIKGIELYETENVTITNNLFFGLLSIVEDRIPSEAQITVHETAKRTYISRNLFYNISRKTSPSVFVSISNDAVVVGNTFTNISSAAVECTGGEVRIYLNNFFNDTTPIWPYTNEWVQDNGLGNYYSDFKGKDENNDGISETSRRFSDDELGSIDKYPLIYPVYYAFPEIHYLGPLNGDAIPSEIRSRIVNVTYPSELYVVNMFFNKTEFNVTLGENVLNLYLFVSGLFPLKVNLSYSINGRDWLTIQQIDESRDENNNTYEYSYQLHVTVGKNETLIVKTNIADKTGIIIEESFTVYLYTESSSGVTNNTSPKESETEPTESNDFNFLLENSAIFVFVSVIVLIGVGTFIFAYKKKRTLT